jgi:protein-tyrosine phosphatase
MKKTSSTHPLRIDVVSPGDGFGRIGITFCPGKVDPYGMSGSWDRDLAADLDVIRDWGAEAVVTLLEPHEFRSFRVQKLGQEVRRRHMKWFHLPIADASIPDETFEREWESAGRKLRKILRSGSDVVVHCRGGLGRAGTIAARLLAELGAEPQQAMAEVRQARPGAIENSIQENFVMKIRAIRDEHSKPLGSPHRAGAMLNRSLDWFENLTGFCEFDCGYQDVRAKLKVEGRQLKSLVNGKTYGIGELELVSLKTLRERAELGGKLPGHVQVSAVAGEARKMHRLPDYAGALFQVASQFNLLEMTGPEVSPEHGVTRYQDDHTQGPACAIAAGAATIYRNYFVPIDGEEGQTAKRQLNGLADVGDALSKDLNCGVDDLWRMRNGYADCKPRGLDAIADHLKTLRAENIDDLRGKLCIGIHQDVEVTDSDGQHRPVVSQAFCSALPVAYSRDRPSSQWEPFARFVLEAAYEATMWAAIVNAQRGASNIVLLTALGAGAFGNDPQWVYAAIRRALMIVRDFGLDVRLVSYRTRSPAMVQLAEEFASH